MPWSSGPGWHGKGGWGAAAAVVLPATYVNSGVHQFASTTDAFAFPTGGVVGDILLIGLNNSTTINETVSIGANGLTALDYDLNFTSIWSLYSRVLTAGDLVTAQLSMSVADVNGGVVMAIYRGAATASKVGRTSVANSATIAMAGFAPSPVSKGVIFIAIDRDETPATTITDDGAQTARLNTKITNFLCYVRDKLSGYTNTTVTVSGFSNVYTTGGQKVGWYVELT